jgi:RimJ/RimL family protein N-acetyltransferase
MAGWPHAETIETARLTLEPLRPGHYEEMFPILDDRRLHAYTGGEPLVRTALRDRYQRLAAGHSPDQQQGWLNWIVRERGTGSVVGTVQATMSRARDRTSAELAWLMAVAAQGRGLAKEAADAMLAWLAQHGVTMFTAHIHPEHLASIAVARHLGLTPTTELVNGETSWLSSRG